MLPGRLQRVPPDTNGQRRRAQNSLPCSEGSILLQENTLWTQECGRNLSKTKEGQFLGHILSKQGNKSQSNRGLGLNKPKAPQNHQRGSKLKWQARSPQQIFSKKRGENPTILQNPKGVPRKERFHVDKGSKQSLKINEEIYRKASHSHSTKSRRKLDHILSSLKRVRECNPNGKKRKRPKAYILSRRLKRYFRAHKITVLTNKPIRLLLMKPKKSRRVARWAIELGEHKIEYKPRNAIKAQVLADFMAETHEEDEEEDFQNHEDKTKSTGWRLYTDGASSDDGFGAGLMIVCLEGMEFTYALKFEFKATNNDAEYEAVIAGLEIEKEIKIEEIIVLVDSQLVAN
ncbi:reverse transcriptase domain-containing protein [Tanacetum coccineum]